MVDHAKELKSWRDAGALAKALTGFAAERAEDAMEMGHLPAELLTALDTKPRRR